MIGILAPYDRSEATMAAVRIANLAIAHGVEVRYVAVGRREPKLHAFWDRHVRSSRDDGVYIATRGCRTLVHFQTSPSLRKQTELVAPDAKHVLVPAWHQLRLEDAALVADHHAVICGSHAHCTSLKDAIFQGVENKIVSWIKYDSGIPAVKRDSAVEYNKVRVCLHANRSVIDVCGPLWLRVITDLFDALPRLDITLLANKSWSAQDRKVIREIERKYPKRFVHKRQTDLDGLNQEFLTHDWALIPWTQACTALVAARALSCGAPVIALDIPPWSEMLNKRQGVLLPCDLQMSRFNAPTAVPDFNQIREALLQTLSCPNLLPRLRSENWFLDRRTEQFTKFWTKVLDLG